MRYQVEPYVECYPDIVKMMEGYRDVTESFHDHLDMDIDHEKYALLESLHRLMVTTVRDEAGTLHGVAMWVVFEDPKHKGSLAASADEFFVDPSSRGHMVGSRLIAESEAILRRIGVKMMGICVKNQDEFMPLVKRHGFDRPQTTWYKWIGD